MNFYIKNISNAFYSKDLIRCNLIKTICKAFLQWNHYQCIFIIKSIQEHFYNKISSNGIFIGNNAFYLKKNISNGFIAKSFLILFYCTHKSNAFIVENTFLMHFYSKIISFAFLL